MGSEIYSRFCTQAPCSYYVFLSINLHDATALECLAAPTTDRSDMILFIVFWRDPVNTIVSHPLAAHNLIDPNKM